MLVVKTQKSQHRNIIYVEQINNQANNNISMPKNADIRRDEAI